MAKNKISEQNKIEAGNLIEKIKEEFEKCKNCGLCKVNCPVFKILKEESISPRGKGILLKQEIIDDIIFKCSLCKSCEKNCPLDIKICDSILKAREVAVLNNKGLKSNKEMVENIKKTGKPF